MRLEPHSSRNLVPLLLVVAAAGCDSTGPVGSAADAVYTVEVEPSITEGGGLVYVTVVAENPTGETIGLPATCPILGFVVEGPDGEQVYPNEHTAACEFEEPIGDGDRVALPAGEHVSVTRQWVASLNWGAGAGAETPLEPGAYQVRGGAAAHPADVEFLGEPTEVTVVAADGS